MASTTVTSSPNVPPAASYTSRDETILPLENGDHLGAAEFMRRYDAMPELKKAELIEGVVYMASPVGFNRHGRPHIQVGMWLAYFEARTPGVLAADNGSIRMDMDNMPQPDTFMIIDPQRGGQSKIGEDDYIEGAPELVAEVASSSASYDLGAKFRVYRRHGVKEYLVWRVRERAIDWFTLRDGEYVRLEPGPDGILRSGVFPGLWLDPAALIAGDLARVLAVLDQGVKSPEHAAFVEALKPKTA